MRDASESDWMANVKRGDARAFRAVVERYESQVVAFCVRFLGDASAARDIAQEVFLTLWDQRRSYQERGKLRLYLLRIARLRCLAALKQRRSRARLARRYADEHAGRAHAADAGTRSDAERVRLALARLKPRHAELIVLRHLEGLDLAEIAEVTGLRIGTIKSRLSRGLAALRGELAHVEK